MTAVKNYIVQRCSSCDLSVEGVRGSREVVEIMPGYTRRQAQGMCSQKPDRRCSRLEGSSIKVKRHVFSFSYFFSYSHTILTRGEGSGNMTHEPAHACRRSSRNEHLGGESDVGSPRAKRLLEVRPLHLQLHRQHRSLRARLRARRARCARRRARLRARRAQALLQGGHRDCLPPWLDF